ncbi:ankyrin repeat domain-containing protein [Parashewanella curva]|uniref:Ankyrin repeat domain-containing protein n=1 Tax=Parashewanella curva TaxID=2338552 RepID=A0A3L8PY33_9GAMM|nr:ankyrin repeat domain-containing protein [Parashewanella curva]RLV60165.1 ankyrin repeat domain-containing protein [Parashewanella curva]
MSYALTLPFNQSDYQFLSQQIDSQIDRAGFNSKKEKLYPVYIHFRCMDGEETVEFKVKAHVRYKAYEAVPFVTHKPFDSKIKKRNYLCKKIGSFTNWYLFFFDNLSATGSRKLICQALERGLNIDRVDAWGNSAIVHAISHDKILCVKYIIEKGADLTHKYGAGHTLLQVAIIKDSKKSIKLLLSRDDIDVNQTGAHSMTALHHASKRGNYKLVSELVERGADVHALDDSNRTPLLYAAGIGCTTCIHLLLNSGANINHTDKQGKSPLMVAALNGYYLCIDFLIEHGAEITARTHSGQTALMLAVESENAGCVMLLNQHGLAVNDSDKFNNTPLMTATRLESYSCVTTLLKLGAEPNYSLFPNKSLQVSTPLHIAAEKGNLNCIGALMCYKASTSVVDQNGKAPLHILAEKGNTKGIKSLMSHEATINLEQVDGDGNSALILAAKNGHQGTIEYLEQMGADVTVKDKLGHDLKYIKSQNNIDGMQAKATQNSRRRRRGY